MVWLLDLGCVLAGLALILTECWVRLRHFGVPRRTARRRVRKLTERIAALPDSPQGLSQQQLEGLKAANDATRTALATNNAAAAGEAGLGIFTDIVKKDVFLAVGALLLFVPLLLQSGYNFTVGSSTPAPTQTPSGTP